MLYSVAAQLRICPFVVLLALKYGQPDSLYALNSIMKLLQDALVILVQRKEDCDPPEETIASLPAWLGVDNSA